MCYRSYSRCLQLNCCAGDSEMAKGSVIVLEQSLVKSKAWLALSGAAPIVYLIFRTKCRIDKPPGKPGKRRRVILNNGELVFTYIEAKSRYGISPSRFRRAIDELIAKGFIDIADTGMGVHKVATCYAISERWRDYGTPGFKEVKRPKPKIANPGFKRGNTLWKKAQKKKSSDENAHGTVYAVEHGELLAMHTGAHGQKIATRYKWRSGKWLAIKIA